MIQNSALRHAARSLAMIPLLLLLSSCAAGRPDIAISKPSISWPMASAKSQIVWVKSISGPDDLGNGRGFWHRMMEVVSGAENSIIDRPYGVLRTTAGKLYITDPGAGLVHCLDIATGSYSAIGSQQGSHLLTPIGLTEDDAGRIYITDSTSGMVYRYDPQDVSLKPLLTNALERPTGIAFHHISKLLYVTDTLASQIVVLDQNGVVRRRIGSYGEGVANFNRPADLVIDAKGQIVVSDSLNFRITVLTPEGNVVRQFGSPGDAQGYFSRPKGLAVDRDGNIYVCDSLLDAVQVFDQNGELQLVFGRRGIGPGHFWLPSGLFIDRLDQVYVVDTYNRRIQVFRYLPYGVEEHEDSEKALFDKPLWSSH